MIRINLVRGKRRKKREFRTDALWFLLPVLALAGLLVFHRSVSGRIASLRAENAAAAAKIEMLKRQIGEVEKFKARKAELQKKVDIISNLQKGRTGPVGVFEALSAATPEKCWVETMSWKGTRIDLSGIALNNDTVANFMTSLGQTGKFKDVVLGSADQTTTMNTKLVKFNLTFQVVPN